MTSIVQIITDIPVELTIEHWADFEREIWIPQRNHTPAQHDFEKVKIEYSSDGSSGAVEVITDQIARSLKRGDKEGQAKVPFDAWYHFEGVSESRGRFYLREDRNIHWSVCRESA